MSESYSPAQLSSPTKCISPHVTFLCCWIIAVALTSSAGASVFLQCKKQVLDTFQTEEVKRARDVGPEYVWIDAGDAVLKPPLFANGPCAYPLEIAGMIQPGDADVLKRVLAASGSSSGGPVIFNSAGGDVYEAMKIGRLLLSNSASAYVGRDSICASSCVLAFAGGLTKGAVAGQLGIHRIQFADQSKVALLSPDDYRKLYDRGMDDIRTYLKEMGIRVNLADEMMRYSSDDAHFLSKQEISYYGLDQENPYAYEMKKARWIALCGEDWWKTKLMAEESVNAKCTLSKVVNGKVVANPDAYEACFRSIMDPVYNLCNPKR